MTGDVQTSGDVASGVDPRGSTTLRITKPSGRAVVTFDYKGAALDLSAFRDIAFPIKNGTSSELDVLLGARNDPKNPWRRSTSGRFLVRPDEEMEMSALLTRVSLPADHPHVKSMGDLFAFPWGYSRHWLGMDPASILQASVQIDWRNGEAGQVIELGPPQGAVEVSTDPALLETFDFPMVDTFGQARWLDWPDKVHSSEDLREDGRRDLALVTAVTNPGERRSRFGGMAGGPELKATGFFRVEKINGKWWFVDPEGNLFWSLGINSTGFGAVTSVKGREHLFAASQRDQEEIRFYEENLKIKYGEDGWREKHTDVTVARMLDWGMNTTGGWSMGEVAETRRVPYTLIVHTAMQRIGNVDKIPDPFSQSFSDSLERSLGKFAEVHGDSPWLLGVFIDNELNWTGDNTLPKEIIRSSEKTAARLALVDFLRQRYGDVAGLNKAWGTDFKNLTAIKPKPGSGGAKAFEKDMGDFLGVFAEKYFSTCRAAMDKYLPHHLYLGSRFHIVNPIVTAAASRHCDVLSVNVYEHSLEGYSVKMEVDRPWLISEFHFGMRDHGNLGVGLTWAADARNQADLVEAYFSDALRHPNFVGAHWFAWGDQGVTGRKDGENFGVGLVTIVDRPVKTLTGAMHQVSRDLYDFRLGDGQGRIGAGEKPPSSAGEGRTP